MSLRVISYGGGVQSTALLVLAATGRLDFDTFLFANVGDDSEHPKTLDYLARHAAPYAAAHGIDLLELSRTRRDGSTETLWGRLMREGSRSVPIPVRMSNGAPGTRSCTADFKIRVIGRWLKAHGATAADPATVGIGISLDEIHRANTRRAEKHERVAYPLLERGLRRTDCARIIRAAGLPVPPKSACFFCPFRRPETWAEMRRSEPELFIRSCELEDTLNARRAALGKDSVFLTRFARPLAQAIPDGVDVLFPLTATDRVGGEQRNDDGSCDSGWCMT